MSIVTVIVAIGFVAILVSIIMMSSIVNFKMKSVNVYAKDSFYSAEQVVDEINVGLQQVVSDGLSYAYTEVMTKYGAEDMTASDKNNLVRATYYQYIWDKLGADDKHTTYTVQAASNAGYDVASAARTANADIGLMALLKDSTIWHYGADDESSYGAFLRAEVEGAVNKTNTDGNYYGKLTTYESTGIVLEDLTVYYKDPNGFISAIRTDIRLGYPEFSFSSGDIPDIANYAFITDTAFVQNNSVTKSSAVDTQITGNTYAYAMDVKGSKINNKPVDGDVDLHIVATDLSITNGGYQTNTGSALWARDIEAKSSNITLYGQSYVLDDLNIKGRNSIFSLKGYYTGFGNSTTNSHESSAILVNGAETTIDLSAARKLTLAGRGYIGTSDSAKRVGRVEETGGDYTGTGDIYTGESIAVKSNQLMYLVPGECIGVTLDDNGKPQESMYGKNPLTLEEYNNIVGRVSSDTKFVEVSGSKPLTKLGGTDSDSNAMNLAAFAATDAYGNPKVEKVFLRTADGSGRLVYYYMTFKDEESANTYFMRYYNLNKASVDKYMSKYLKAITLPTSGILSLRLDLAAEAVEGDVNGYEVADYVRVPQGGNTISEDFELAATEYTHQYQAYCSKLTPDYDTLADSANSDILRDSFPEYDAGNNKMKVKESESVGRELDPETHKYYNDNYYSVFKNLVDEEVLKEMVDGKGSLELSGSEGKALLIYRDDVDTVVDVSTGFDLIIANCGVRLSGATFKGCIIAKGIIEVPSGNVTLTHDPDKVGSCLLLETEDLVYRVSDVFGDIDDLDYLKAVKSKGETVTSASLVTYENWTKNVNIK